MSREHFNLSGFGKSFTPPDQKNIIDSAHIRVGEDLYIQSKDGVDIGDEAASLKDTGGSELEDFYDRTLPKGLMERMGGYGEDAGYKSERSMKKNPGKAQIEAEQWRRKLKRNSPKAA